MPVNQLETSSHVISSLAAVETEIAKACGLANRKRDDVTLVAVSKTFGADEIVPVLAAGQRVFGENRVQEARLKWPELTARFTGTQLHLIGPLQSNKAKEAVALFDAIHSIDRDSLCETLPARLIVSRGRFSSLFRLTPVKNRKRRGLSQPKRMHSSHAAGMCTGWRSQGWMCIPPWLMKLRRRILRSWPRLPRAIAFHFCRDGNERRLCNRDLIWRCATHVRVGSAIFGHRD